MLTCVALLLAGGGISTAIATIPVTAVTILLAVAMGLALALALPSKKVLEAVFLTLPLWPLSMMPSGVLSRLFVGNVIVGALVGRWLLSPGRVWNSLPRMERPLIAVCLVATASLLVSFVDPVPGITYDYPHESVPRWAIGLTEFGLLTGIWAAPHAVARFTSISDNGRLWGAFYVGASLASVEVIASFVLQTGSASILGHLRPSNSLYYVAVVALPFLVNDWLKGRHRLLITIGAALCALATVVSFSRQAWVWASIGVAVSIVMNSRRKSLTIAALSATALSCGALGAFDFYNPEHVYGLERTNYYWEALSLFARHPILGVGTGNYQFFSLSDANVMQGGIAHNQFFTALAESGMLMIPVLLWLLVSVMRFAWETDHHIRPGAIGFVVGWFSSLLASEMALPTTAAGGGTQFALYIVLVWLILGLLVPLHPKATVGPMKAVSISASDTEVAAARHRTALS